MDHSQLSSFGIKILLGRIQAIVAGSFSSNSSIATTSNRSIKILISTKRLTVVSTVLDK